MIAGGGIKGGTGETAEDLFGGMGGFAGIHVPHYDTETTITNYKISDGAYVINKNGTSVSREVESTKKLPAGDAVLNLSGSGTLIARGRKCW